MHQQNLNTASNDSPLADARAAALADQLVVAVIASVSVAVTVGMIFGYYPAWRASRLDPIEALPYE